MINELLPEIGSRGVFKFKQPFDRFLGPTTNYTCKSIRKISELLSKSESVYLNYYKKYDLSGADYATDLNNDISIVGLFSAKGVWYYVPASFILSYPDNTGVVYRRMIMGAELGPIPDSLNLDGVSDVVADTIYRHIGIRPIIKNVAISQTGLVKAEDHEQIENARKSKIKVDKPLSLVIDELTKERNDAFLKIKELEKYIKERL